MEPFQPAHYTAQRAADALKNKEGGKGDDRSLLGVQIYKALYCRMQC